MKVTVIYGSERKGSTYHCVQQVKEVLSESGEITFTEFFMPRDLPEFCKGCFNCFKFGEEKCPHRKFTGPIEAALREADGIILSSPTYALEVSAGLKNLFDHLCYQWMPHRPRPEMFSKTAMVLSTTAGAGADTSAKTMRKNLTYWGVSKIFSFSTAVAAMNWEEVSPEKKAGISPELEKTAGRFMKAMRRGHSRPNFFIRMLFFLMGKMISGYGADVLDRRYWQEKGWLDGKKPF